MKICNLPNCLIFTAMLAMFGLVDQSIQAQVPIYPATTNSVRPMKSSTRRIAGNLPVSGQSRNKVSQNPLPLGTFGQPLPSQGVPMWRWSKSGVVNQGMVPTQVPQRKLETLPSAGSQTPRPINLPSSTLPTNRLAPGIATPRPQPKVEGRFPAQAAQSVPIKPMSQSSERVTPATNSRIPVIVEEEPSLANLPPQQEPETEAESRLDFAPQVKILPWSNHSSRRPEAKAKKMIPGLPPVAGPVREPGKLPSKLLAKSAKSTRAETPIASSKSATPNREITESKTDSKALENQQVILATRSQLDPAKQGQAEQQRQSLAKSGEAKSSVAKSSVAKSSVAKSSVAKSSVAKSGVAKSGDTSSEKLPPAKFDNPLQPLPLIVRGSKSDREINSANPMMISLPKSKMTPSQPILITQQPYGFQERTIPDRSSTLSETSSSRVVPYLPPAKSNQSQPKFVFNRFVEGQPKQAAAVPQPNDIEPSQSSLARAQAMMGQKMIRQSPIVDSTVHQAGTTPYSQFKQAGQIRQASAETVEEPELSKAELKKKIEELMRSQNAEGSKATLTRSERT